MTDQQLIIAVTVPARELVAHLICVGWLFTRPTPPILTAAEIQALEVGKHVAFVRGDQIVVDRFLGTRDSRGETQAHIGGSHYPIDRLTVLANAVAGGTLEKTPLIPAGDFVSALGHRDRWPLMQLSTQSDVAIVGTKAWLTEEAEIELAAGANPSDWTSVNNLLLTFDGRRPTWLSRVLASASFEGSEIPDSAALVVLDGNAAASWVTTVGSPVVVVIIDRSTENELAVESVLQFRATSLPMDLSEIGWSPPLGAEATAFRRQRVHT